MSSILTNAAALSALQSLTETQSALKTTEKQVSTGLAVSSAADNASYWSIATQLTSNSGVVTSSNQALAQSQAVMSTASSAINSIITTINSIESALTQAATPGASIANINTTLGQLGKQLSDAVNGASFNGLNLLNGSQTSQLNFVAGFNATATGGSINTIGFTAQSMTGGTATTTTVAKASVSGGATSSAAFAALTSGAGTPPTPTIGGVTLTNNNTEVLTAVNGGADTTVATSFTTIMQDSSTGAVHTKTYYALDASGNSTNIAAATQFSVSAASTGASTTTQSANITMRHGSRSHSGDHRVRGKHDCDHRHSGQHRERQQRRCSVLGGRWHPDQDHLQCARRQRRLVDGSGRHPVRCLGSIDRTDGHA